MPYLKLKDVEELVLISGSIIWHENGAVLKDGFMDGKNYYYLFDPLTGGYVYAADKRFEKGLRRFTSLVGTVAYRFDVNGARLPKPRYRFDPADPANSQFMKYMVHEVTLGGGHACFRKPE